MKSFIATVFTLAIIVCLLFAYISVFGLDMFTSPRVSDKPVDVKSIYQTRSVTSEEIYNLSGMNFTEHEIAFYHPKDVEKIDELIELIQKHRKGVGFLISVDDAVYKVLEMNEEIFNQSKLQNIPPEMIAAVLVKETAFLWVDDFGESEDSSFNKTVGLSQTSVNRTKENERILSNPDYNHTSMIEGLSDRQILSQIIDENNSPYFAAVQLRAIFANNVNDTDLDWETRQKKVFEIYNCNEVEEDTWYGPYSQKTYGEHVYQYSKIIREIFDIWDYNKKVGSFS